VSSVHLIICVNLISFICRQRTDHSLVYVYSVYRSVNQICKSSQGLGLTTYVMVFIWKKIYKSIYLKHNQLCHYAFNSLRQTRAIDKLAVYSKEEIFC